MRAKAHKMALTPRVALIVVKYVSLPDQIQRTDTLGKSGLLDGGTFSAYHFFQVIIGVSNLLPSFEVFLSTLKLPAFAVQ